MERIFNLFLYMDRDGIIYELGGVAHEADGTDNEKLERLKGSVDADCMTAKHYPVPDRYMLVTELEKPSLPRLRYEAYDQMSKLGKSLELFEEIFVDLGAPQNPLVCVTPIVDGTPVIDGTLGPEEPTQGPAALGPKRVSAGSGANRTGAPVPGVNHLFPAGTVVMSAGAEKVLEGSGMTAEWLLTRHLTGDFGEAGNYASIQLSKKERKGETDDTGKLNKIAIDSKEGRIMSVYSLSTDCTIWVITDWYGGHVVRTVLRPEDY
jgi:hypothetical protein